MFCVMCLRVCLLIEIKRYKSAIRIIRIRMMQTSDTNNCYNTVEPVHTAFVTSYLLMNINDLGAVAVSSQV